MRDSKLCHSPVLVCDTIPRDAVQDANPTTNYCPPDLLLSTGPALLGASVYSREGWWIRHVQQISRFACISSGAVAAYTHASTPAIPPGRRPGAATRAHRAAARATDAHLDAPAAAGADGHLRRGGTGRRGLCHRRRGGEIVPRPAQRQTRRQCVPVPPRPVRIVRERMLCECCACGHARVALSLADERTGDAAEAGWRDPVHVPHEGHARVARIAASLGRDQPARRSRTAGDVRRPHAQSRSSSQRGCAVDPAADDTIRYRRLPRPLARIGQPRGPRTPATWRVAL